MWKLYCVIGLFSAFTSVAPQYNGINLGSFDNQHSPLENQYHNGQSNDYRSYNDYSRNTLNSNNADANARTISNDLNLEPDGKYQFQYETENGIRAHEYGTPTGELSKFVQGSYTYTSPEGTIVTVDYTADEYGFHPHITYSGVNAAQYVHQPAPADISVSPN